MKSVCVLCGGNRGSNPAYHQAAYSLGATLAKSGLELVFGGGQVGMMGIVADAALQHGGAVVGVITESLVARDLGHIGVTKLEVVGSMHERKARMAARANAFVALPGGFGTLNELLEILTWAQLGLHRKPCAVLNVGGYFDGLLAFLDRAADEQLLCPENRALLLVESDPARLVQRFRTYTPPALEMWAKPGLL